MKRKQLTDACVTSEGGFFEGVRYRCRFEKRENVVGATPEQILSLDKVYERATRSWPDTDNLSTVLDALATRTYVCDVCVACGKIVKLSV